MQLPLLQKLWRLDDELRQQKSRRVFPGLSVVGLEFVRQPENGAYWCTPRNTVVFASDTNSNHFSFVQRNGKFSEDSPVVMTSPGTRSLRRRYHNNVVVGENLRDFLSLGVRTGYHSLIGLASGETSVEEVVNDRRGLNRDTIQVLARLRQQFELVPWAEPREGLRRLRRQYWSLLDIPDPISSIRHATLEKLWKLDHEAQRRFPPKYDEGFGGLGLIMNYRLEFGGYHNTPRNTLQFARTGGGGVHFSLMIHGGRIAERSPVIMTVPEGGGLRQTFVVGENLFDFLCLGMRRGYFCLEQLSFSYEATVEAYSDFRWEQPSIRKHHVIDLATPELRPIVKFLASRFRLKPWRNVARKLERLHILYYPLVKEQFGRWP